MIDTLIKVWALHFLFGLFLYVGFNTILYKRSRHIKAMYRGDLLNSRRTKMQLFLFIPGTVLKHDDVDDDWLSCKFE